MNSARPYSSALRAERAAATRQRILDAAQALFDDPSQDFTLDRVAAAAGVSVQTLLRAHGSREGLIVAAIGTSRDSLAPVTVEPFASVPDAIRTLFDDYERIGDRVIRVLAEEQHIAGFAEAASRGRAMHRRWVEVAFADHTRGLRGRKRSTTVTALVAATDVYVWKLLRRDLLLERGAAESTVVLLVNGIVGTAKES